MEEKREPTREQMIDEIRSLLEDATYMALHSALAMLKPRKQTARN